MHQQHTPHVSVCNICLFLYHIDVILISGGKTLQNTKGGPCSHLLDTTPPITALTEMEIRQVTTMVVVKTRTSVVRGCWEGYRSPPIFYVEKNQPITFLKLLMAQSYISKNFHHLYNHPPLNVHQNAYLYYNIRFIKIKQKARSSTTVERAPAHPFLRKKEHPRWP